jgi:putative CocE/NonD family hydrolase
MSLRRRCTWRTVLAAVLLALGGTGVTAQELEFHPPVSPLDGNAAVVMRDLAARVLPVYEEKNAERFLVNLAAIQVIAGNYGPARASRDEWRERRREGESARENGEVRLLDIYVRALESAGQGRGTFPQTFTQVFRDAVTPLADRNASILTGWRHPDLLSLERGLQQSFDQRRSRDVIALADAVELLRRYFEFDAYRRFGNLHESLSLEDDQRRYFLDTVRIPGWGGARIAVVVARPRNAPGRLPALLQFELQRDPRSPVTGPAAHGYAGVVAYTRLDEAGAPRVVPFQHDGEDARAVLRWIARQGWSDGRVGMYGEGYSGFAAWAAAKGAPAQLKAIATSDPSAPGIDTPMSGNIPHNSAYRWVQRVAGSRGDEANFDDDADWRALDEAWYRSGRRYRDLERLKKRPNRYFQRWLNHPSYDRFWQKMIPFREQFAAIKIPVLTFTGYFSPAQPGALYYLNEHQRYNAQADHTLLVGPYAQASGEVFSGDRPGALLRRLPVDAVARIELDELRYQWFDHVLRGAARPGLLQDRVNFQTMGANEWRHAPTLAGMSNASLRFYLDAKPVPGGHLLAQLDKPNASFFPWQVALRERELNGFTATPDLLARAPQSRYALTYTSEPLTSSLDIAGVPGGQLDFTTNKQDIDFTVAMYEQQQNGDFVKLFDPSAAFRASYARDRTQRRLLYAGRRQRVTFSSERVTSRRIAAGSRLVVILGVNMRPDQEINYGSGNDVSEESSADARIPLRIRWRSTSYIDVPVRR